MPSGRSRDRKALPHAIPVERLSELVETAPDAVIVVDGEGTITLANQRAVEFLGYRRHELVGKPVEILVPKEARARHKNHVAKFFRAAKIRLMGERGLALRAVRKDGVEIPVDISLGPVPTGAGIHVMAVLRDFGRHQAEANRRAEEVERLEGALGTLGHELGNYLTPIKLQLHFLKLRLAPEERPLQESLALLERDVERLGRLLTDILSAVRLRRGHLPARLRAVDLGPLVRDMVLSFTGATREKDLELELKSDPSPIWCQVDPDRIHEVFFNLLTNAWKFTPRGGRIEVRLERQGKEVLLCVRDTGRGIEPDELQRLFLPFSRAPGVRQEGVPGLGLGLYLSRGIVELHHGRIWGESEGHGRGASFFVRLPLGPE